jgi:hypothetical protein
MRALLEGFDARQYLHGAGVTEAELQAVRARLGED